MSKFDRKFTVGSLVVINRDVYNNYPKGTRATVIELGMLHNGVPNYLVEFSDDFVTRLPESELTAAK